MRLGSFEPRVDSLYKAVTGHGFQTKTRSRAELGRKTAACALVDHGLTTCWLRRAKCLKQGAIFFRMWLCNGWHWNITNNLNPAVPSDPLPSKLTQKGHICVKINWMLLISDKKPNTKKVSLKCPYSCPFQASQM